MIASKEGQIEKTVTFVADAVVKVDGAAEVRFTRGTVETLNVASADRWIRRGVAAEGGKKPAKAKAKKE